MNAPQKTSPLILNLYREFISLEFRAINPSQYRQFTAPGVATHRAATETTSVPFSIGVQMEKGFLAFGITDSEGKFEVKSFNNGNMPIGKYDVMIAPPAGSEAADLSAEERFDKPELIAPKVRIMFPARYRETTTSGLHYEIKEGENNFEIDLKPK